MSPAPRPELLLGIEEEYQLVDPVTGELRPDCKQVMRSLGRRGDAEDDAGAAEIQHELHLNMIEMASPVCASLAEVRDTLRQTRRELIEAAEENGLRLAAAGTNPLPIPEEPAVTPKTRYERMTERYQKLARDLFIFGCHVHVSMPDRELGLRVMNRSRRWLPVLQALTANSPYWDGADTGYDSYRRELWVQWPLAGPPPEFRDMQDYEACIEELTRTGAIRDESFLYWDIRLPTKVPTIEFRNADVLTNLEDAVAHAGLVRAIVRTAIADDEADADATPGIRAPVLRFAMWQAARYGVSGELIDPVAGEAIPAVDLVHRMREELAAALEQDGDLDVVTAYLDRTLREGNGATRQRAAFDGDLSSVVNSTADATARLSSSEPDPASTPV